MNSRKFRRGKRLRRGPLGIVVYHTTAARNAFRILDGGFKDGTGTYMTRNTYRGVWVSNIVLDASYGATGNVTLQLEVAISAAELKKYEWVEECKGYREWLIPAKELNPRVRRIRIWQDWVREGWDSWKFL